MAFVHEYSWVPFVDYIGHCCCKAVPLNIAALNSKHFEGSTVPSLVLTFIYTSIYVPKCKFAHFSATFKKELCYFMNLI